MPALGKETERQLTPDEIALREIQGYVDKVERQVETQQPQTNKPVQAPQMATTAVTPDPLVISNLAPVTTKQKITLPLDQSGIETGLKNDVLEGFRWLSEWCVLMIKKYPGRVFYLPPKTNT